MGTRKFSIGRNSRKVDSIEIRCIHIAQLLSRSDLGKHLKTTFFKLMVVKFYRHYFFYRYIVILFSYFERDMS